MPKVSIIIPVYNVERYIERCARSLFEQTLDDIEYIFVDDASPDNSIDVVKSVLLEYPNRQESVVFVKHETNKGLSGARNSGLRIARGEYIAHCDSDDWVDLDMYNILYNEATKKDADAVMCNLVFAKKNSIEIYQTVPFTSDKQASLKQYMLGGMTSLCNMLVRKKVYTENHLSPTIGINYCEDFILSVKLLHKANKVTHVDQALYYYNQLNTDSLLRSRRVEAEQEEVKAYLDVISYLKEEGAYNLYAKQLCWRVLKAKQEWILDPQCHELFMQTFPECHKYIWSCPMINNKLKLMMWCKVHHLEIITNGFIRLRQVLNR